ncbi:MAG: HAD hydrolase-like protein [Stomatobaculum sp.]|nr:HAD hydrolase-like protein [Stomatobaculum sp.]
MIKYVFFDFDGTVYDTVEGITKSIQYALRQRGMDAELHELRKFAGPPLADKFMEVYHVSEQDAIDMVRVFRERYAPIGIFESKPFPGIKRFLLALKAAGLKVGVATSKPQNMAEQLIEKGGLTECFDVVVGSRIGPGNDKKWEILSRAMEQCGAEKENSVLVGDTKYDVGGARKCGIPCIGVRWGYAAEGELEEAGADIIFDTMKELERFLTGNPEF